MSLEANRFLSHLTAESVEDERRQQTNLIKEIQKRGDKEIDVMPTKYLDEASYQKFRRTLGLIIKQINESNNALLEFDADQDDETLEYNALTDVSNIVLKWNEMCVSLSLLGYDKLYPTDKQKIYKDISTLKPYFQQLLVRTDPAAMDFSQEDMLKNTNKSIDDMIRQIDSNIFKPVTVPIGSIPIR